MISLKKNIPKPIVVISAVNINEGGPLSIMKDAVYSFFSCYISAYNLVLLVNNKSLFRDLINHGSVRVVEYNYPKKSWLLRAWFEYVHTYFISKKIKPYLWISMHDTSPVVSCTKQVVYCHNPAPFYEVGMKETRAEKSIFFFHFFYSFFYRINIRANRYVIVQQQWLREEFIKRFKINNVVVAYPSISIPRIVNGKENRDKKFSFFYPALPRVFKNFELLFKAVEHLQKKNTNFEILTTINGSENSYSRNLVKKYGHLSCIKFIGVQRRENIWNIYNDCSCLIFPSKMETWGLPITEIKHFNKPILVANCRYAIETIGDYSKVCYFDPDDSLALSELMEAAIYSSLKYTPTVSAKPSQPFAQTWEELFSLILS